MNSPQLNYPVHYDFQNYCNNVPPTNYIVQYSANNVAATNHLPFCKICNQNFRTPVLYNRHIRSRKHALQCIRPRIQRRRNRANQSLSLLPNDVIESLICDLSTDETDSFFDDIDLTPTDELLPSHEQVLLNDRRKESFSTSSQRRDGLTNNTNVPKIYPCSLCFRSLHSQELFDRHLQEKHFCVNETIFYE